jgi:hypothetical protein
MVDADRRAALRDITSTLHTQREDVRDSSLFLPSLIFSPSYALLK